MWNAPSSNGGSPITKYNVYRGIRSGTNTFLIELGNILNYTDSGLTNGQTYYYNITAVNVIDEGPSSSEISATPTLYIQVLDHFTINPSGPLSVSVHNIVHFNATAYDSNNNNISGATFTWNVTYGIGTVTPKSGADTTFTSTKTGTKYIEVTCIYNGVSKSSEVIVTVTSPPDPPPQPSNNDNLIIGVSATIIIAVIVIGIIVYAIKRKNKKQDKN
jgi:hypothetical protein